MKCRCSGVPPVTCHAHGILSGNGRAHERELPHPGGRRQPARATPFGNRDPAATVADLSQGPVSGAKRGRTKQSPRMLVDPRLRCKRQNRFFRRFPCHSLCDLCRCLGTLTRHSARWRQAPPACAAPPRDPPVIRRLRRSRNAAEGQRRGGGRRIDLRGECGQVNLRASP